MEAFTQFVCPHPLLAGGMHALSLQLAENYVAAFGRLAEGSNTLIVPADAANASRLLGQALGVFRAVDKSCEAPCIPVPFCSPAYTANPSPLSACTYTEHKPPGSPLQQKFW